MPSGRCSGCELTGSSKKIAVHIITCHAYLELHRRNPAGCLSPQAEADRHRSGNTPEARATRRDERLRVRFAELDHEVRVQTGRWKTPADLLDD